MSEITFRASELSALYEMKAAREIASAFLNPGSNADTEATAWIDSEQIRENKGKDQVIDALLHKNPQPFLQDIYDKTNPQADISNYCNQKNVAVDSNEISNKIKVLEERIDSDFNNKVRELVNTKGPIYTIEFIEQIKGQIKECLGEMRSELERFSTATTSKDSAIKTAIEEYKAANNKFFGKKNAIQEAKETLCDAVNKAVINTREIKRRNGAITFYVWFTQRMNDAEQKLNNIANTIQGACKILKNNIAIITNDLKAPRGLFVVDLTEPYIEKVDVQPDDVNVNQFVQSLPKDVEIYGFDMLNPQTVADYMTHHTSTLNSGGIWESMSVEDALSKLSKTDMNKVIQRAIKLSSPMCPLNYRGHLNKPLNNYYYIGVQEQSSTIVDLDSCIPAGEMHESYFSSIGSKDRIVFYHQYGVFPTYAIAGTESYRHSHDNYMSRQTAYSCFIDEDMHIAMQREGFSVLPVEKTDNSLELWVKGLIFGLISRDNDGTFRYKDENNDEMALFGYWTSLDSKYRDEAFKNFKRVANDIQQQYEDALQKRAKSEGQDAINALINDAKLNYLQKYSLNDLEESNFKNQLYKGIVQQLTAEVKYVNKEM
jgi:hypothetical protein